MLKNEKNDAARFSANIEQGWVYELKIETTFSISLSLSLSLFLNLSFFIFLPLLQSQIKKESICCA